MPQEVAEEDALQSDMINGLCRHSFHRTTFTSGSFLWLFERWKVCSGLGRRWALVEERISFTLSGIGSEEMFDKFLRSRPVFEFSTL